MTNHRDLDVLDAADLAAEKVNRLIDTAPRRLINVAQMRRSVGAVSALIAEGFARGTGPERDYKLRTARVEAEAFRALRHFAPLGSSRR